MFAEIAQALPVKHVASPDEIAEAYLFLMKYVSASTLKSISDRTSRCNYVTGQRIDVDGGYVII